MRLLSLFSTIAVTVCLFGPAITAHAADDDQIERLLDAIAQVESRGEHNAVGDGGRAVGMYQIHRKYWQDGTRILGVDWQYRDASDPVKARRVVRAYLCHYGRNRTLLEMARIHNGGPKGYCKPATREYAKKIEAVLGTAQTS
jgi:hypothetical protein